MLPGSSGVSVASVFVKICGITCAADATSCVDAGADAAVEQRGFDTGFIGQNLLLLGWAFLVRRSY